MRFRKRHGFVNRFQNREANKKGRIRLPKQLFKLLLIIFILGCLGYLFSKIFLVRTVDVVFDGYACGDESSLVDGLGLKNQQLFLINTEVVNKRIKNDFACVKQVQLNKYYPDRVAVLVVGRKPIASVVQGIGLGGLIDLAQVEATAASSAATVDFSIPSVGSDKFFIDEDGVLFYSTGGDVNLPLVFVNQELSLKMSLGSVLGGGIRDVLDMLVKLNMNPKLLKVSMSGTMIIVDVQEMKVILNLKGEYLKQLASLQLILQKNKIDSKRIESVDLRFAKPVVIYSK